jgi:23S rRNA pseudouridine2605 synthase
VGLARALSKLGYCSRSQAGELIRAGRVRLNGTVRRDPESPVRLGKDRIDVDAQPLEASPRVYLMMNKPRGIVTTASDEKGRKTVYDLLAPDLPWLAPVGRLDKASEGLLLLTNDSEWAGKVMAPETHLDKTYHVQIDRIADKPLLDSMLHGVSSSDQVLRVKQVTILRSGQKNSWLEVVLDEGKNRQIRRILESLGAEVLRLIRVALGPLQLGKLPKGGTRPVTAAEKLAIDRALKLPIEPPRKMNREV